METFNKIDEVLNIKTEIVEAEIEVKRDDVETLEDPSTDYEYTRTQLYSLIEKGQTAVNGILDVASGTDHPRAYEVAGQLIKNVADITDKLIDLQKKMKDLDTKYRGPTTVNNSLFVGSTAELSKLIKQGLLNNKEEKL
jgi:hypothetical protein